MLIGVSIISIYFGIKTITSKNPILSILFLIGLFFSISIYLIYIGLHFIGLSYLLVYIGAVSILFLFILMLINIRTSELLTDNYNSIPLAILTILLFNNSLNTILHKDKLIDITDYLNRSSEIFINSLYDLPSSNFFNTWMEQSTNNYIAAVSSKTWESMLIQLTHISSIGNVLYTYHYIEFIMASLILLLAMVGCIKITISNENSADNNSKITSVEKLSTSFGKNQINIYDEYVAMMIEPERSQAKNYITSNISKNKIN